MMNFENDPFVKEIFALAETDEIAKMADDVIAQYKSENNVSELKESEIFQALNASYIASRFFGKSRYWISQRLNKNIVNGKEAQFTPEEYKKLKSAIETIADELQELAEIM